MMNGAPLSADTIKTSQIVGIDITLLGKNTNFPSCWLLQFSVTIAVSEKHRCNG